MARGRELVAEGKSNEEKREVPLVTASIPFLFKLES